MGHSIIRIEDKMLDICIIMSNLLENEARDTGLHTNCIDFEKLRARLPRLCANFTSSDL